MVRVRPAIARPIVVLPEPDSPTRPSTSPGHGEADAVDGLERRAAEPPRVLDEQVLGLDQHFAALVGAFDHALRGGVAAQVRDGGEELLGVLLLGLRRTAPVRIASSTTSPWYMTTTRSARSATTPMLCVISTIDGPELVAQVPQQVEDLGLHGDVEGGRRLVGDDEARVQRQRHGDDDALLLAARELVRVVVDARFRVRDADLAEDLDRPRLGLLGRDLAAAASAGVCAEALGDLPADREDRVERGRRLLEHHGHVAAADLPQLAPR